MAKTKVWRGSQHKPMSPKTLKNLHGLLSSILADAVQAEPPSRARNPCELTRLPRLDEDGENDDGGEHMEFMSPDEVEGIVSCLAGFECGRARPHECDAGDGGTAGTAHGADRGDRPVNGDAACAAGRRGR